MMSVSEIVGAVGRGSLRDKLGVGDAAISNAISRGVFPARWWGVLKAECDTIGIECPLEAFSFAICVSPSPDEGSTDD